MKGTYEFIPAGLDYFKHGGIGIYIRYRSGSTNKIVLKSWSPLHFHIECPDRELYIVGDTQRAYGERPMTGSWDSYVNLSSFHEKQARDFGIKTYMTNYFENTSRANTAGNLRRSGKKGDITYISDSGGFQIFSGVVDYLDPAKVVKWYNDNVDIGMVLDIPGNAKCISTYQRAAEVQRINTEIMLKYKAPHVDLMNIFHGSLDEHRKAYRAICEHQDIDRIAIGSAYFGSVMSSIDNIFDIVTTGRQYKHYHVLGVSNILQLILIMHMVSKGLVPYITSDSTTAINLGMTKRYNLYPHVGAANQTYVIGNTNTFPSTKNILPCNCPVCATIKYTDVLSIINGQFIHNIIAHHNIFAMNLYYSNMAYIVSEASTAEIKSLVTSQLRSAKSGFKEMLRGLDYIDHIVDHGISSARNAFNFYLAKGLFASDSSKGIINKQLEPKNDAHEQHMDRVISLYEGDRSKLVHMQKSKGQSFVKSVGAHAKGRVPPGYEWAQKRKGGSKNADN